MTDRLLQPSDPAIAGWLAEHGFAAARWEPLAGDLSPRRYFRLQAHHGETALVALYPRSQRHDCSRFLASTELLRRAGIAVPSVLSAECSRGLMLLEDLGPSTLYDLGRRGGAALLEDYFRHAAQISERIAALDPGPVARLNPPLGTELLSSELRTTREALLEPFNLLGEPELFDQSTARLCQRLGESQPVPCHRDFMVRNLMPVGPAPGLAVLDHQGLRLGPPLYDLASLLNDSLFLPGNEESRLLSERIGEAERRVAFHRAAAQRTLKAAGTYAAFARKGHPRHFALVPETLERALNHLASCPETTELAARLRPLWSSFNGRDRRPAPGPN